MWLEKPLNRYPIARCFLSTSATAVSGNGPSRAYALCPTVLHHHALHQRCWYHAPRQCPSHQHLPRVIQRCYPLSSGNGTLLTGAADSSLESSKTREGRKPPACGCTPVWGPLAFHTSFEYQRFAVLVVAASPLPIYSHGFHPSPSTSDHALQRT